MALPPAGERLEEQLRLLKLTRIAPVLDSIAQACAREKAGYLDFLSRLLEIELEERRERKVDLLQRFAAFPYKKSLEQFDFDFQPTVDRRLIADLATLRFLDHACSFAGFLVTSCALCRNSARLSGFALS